MFVATDTLAFMHVSLTPELERKVKEKVAAGLYNNASEVIREALRLALRTDAENEWLKREAAIGFAQLEAGETVRVTTKRQFVLLARGGK
jgi:antitoxin ParD1/3/4